MVFFLANISLSSSGLISAFFFSLLVFFILIHIHLLFPCFSKSLLNMTLDSSISFTVNKSCRTFWPVLICSGCSLSQLHSCRFYVSTHIIPGCLLTSLRWSLCFLNLMSSFSQISFLTFSKTFFSSSFLRKGVEELFFICVFVSLFVFC